MALWGIRHPPMKNYKEARYGVVLKVNIANAQVEHVFREDYKSPRFITLTRGYLEQ